jgi:hypothetical protein
VFPLQKRLERLEALLSSNLQNDAGARAALQLPEKAATVRSIKTDDPAGIEAYYTGGSR